MGGLSRFDVGLRLGNPSSKDERYCWGNTISGLWCWKRKRTTNTRGLLMPDVGWNGFVVRSTAELQVHICGLVVCADGEKPQVVTALSS